MAKYDHKKIEKKWQKYWSQKRVYESREAKGKKKMYILDMFPYPSGEGLHVGHPRGYIGTDVYSRFKKMQGFNILHPMGFDSFGLPAEQFAMKHKIHPEIAVKKNIKRYKEQISILGLNYDWKREVVTSDPEYYKWTQWIFLQLFKKGLTFESFEPINWCPSCQTGLANEDLEHGRCERCGSVVEKRPIRQWVLKITKYADRLLEDLKILDWPESDKESQRNWIGRSEGALIKFPVKNSGLSVEVFTTRPDTLFGATYLVLAPEHPLLEKLKDGIKNWDEVQKYINQVKNKTDLERTDLSKEKTGVELKGVRAINPGNKEEISVWIADYVLGSYGTGSIMAVPAHDERDFEFAKKFYLPFRHVVLEDGKLPASIENVYAGPGILANSGQFSGMTSGGAKDEIVRSAGGKKMVLYKLRDWVFSRQRYWGEPIPLIHCLACGVVPVPEKDLPVKLPKVKSYEPTGTGESPLAAISKWVNVKCPKCGGPGKRETNTMPQWAGSCWYYLRFMDSKNKKVFADPKKEKYWAPVDLYVGGTEHTTRHLIYARFWHKFLYDIGAVHTPEPFMKLRHQGLILAEDGRKMSKRWGNVINPDDIVRTYGADTMRIFEMFQAPFDQNVSWKTESIMGSRRFIERIWRIASKVRKKADISDDLERLLHKTIKKVTEDIENLNFNTAISAMMILSNEMEKAAQVDEKSFKNFLKILAPFAPHVADELWNNLGEKKTIHHSVWPDYNPDKIKDDMVNIAIQVNGKVRGEVLVPADAPEKEIREIVLSREVIKKWIEGKAVKKFIYVPGRLANIVL